MDDNEFKTVKTVIWSIVAFSTVCAVSCNVNNYILTKSPIVETTTTTITKKVIR